ncbi:hypothetical protein DY000_02042935 [Brassica cretica]|uniref:DOG1 domain-containing protein n=1 Tax=Brassica cretica TaxID=69181 RepID=A0ABQ7B6E4_BRACR|nr:hypothetical protein DY000_02042935 [Brassica cretica]
MHWRWESSQQGGSSLASGLRGKFMSLIDGMISECGSETSRLAGELLELQGRWELERDLGKTASSFLKEKKARKARSSEVRRLQRQIEVDAGLASRGIQEATDALRSEFQARLAKIFCFSGFPWICFESSSARFRIRGIPENVEYKHRGMVLGSRIFLISCLEMLETSALGLGQDLGLLSVLRFMR